MGHHGRVRRRPHPLAVAAAASLVLAAPALTACTGGGHSRAAATTTAPGVATSDAAPPIGRGPGHDIRTVGAVVYFAGFRLRVAGVDFDRPHGRLAVSVGVVNAAAAPGTLDAAAMIESHGASAPADVRLADPVPADGSAATTASFAVPDTFNLDDATLSIGRPDHARAVVPLGGGDRPGLVDLAPQPVPARGTLRAGAVAVSVDGAELRADDVDGHRQADTGSRFFVVHAGASADRDAVFTWEACRLQGPDGLRVAATGGSVQALSAGHSAAVLTAVFAVPADVRTASLTLVYDDGTNRGQLALSQ